MLKNEFEKFFVFLQQVELDINHGHLLPGGDSVYQGQGCSLYLSGLRKQV